MVVYRLIHATGPSGAGTVTYTDSGGPSGLTPVAAKITATVVTADDADTTTSRFSEGYYDGTNQRACGIVMENNDATANAHSSVFADSSKVVVIGDTPGSTTPALTGAAAGFGVNTLDITWDAALPNLHFDIVLIYGCLARVTSFACNGTIGSTASTSGGPGTPTAVFVTTTGTAFSAGGAAAGGGFGTGFAGRLPSTTQACVAIHWNDAQPTATRVGNLPRNDAVCTYMTDDATEGTRLVLEGSPWNSDGITFTTRNANVSIEFMVLEIVLDSAIRAWAGAPTLPTSTLGSFSRTDPGFRPQALFFAAVRSAAINTIGTTQGNISLGQVAANGQGNTACFSRDNQATSETRSRHSGTYCGTINQAGGTPLYRFSHTSFDATGWSGSVATAGASDLLVPYLAIEDAQELVTSDTENITDQHAMMVGLAQSETENLTDQHAFMVGLAQSETEDITESVVLVAFSISNAVVMVVSDSMTLVEDEDLYLGNVIIASDTERITDDTQVFTASMALSDTVNLVENQNFAGSALIVVSDEVDISESVLQYLGRLIVQSDTENITEDVNFGSGLIPRHGTERGTTLQGGAEEGVTLGAHAERGTILG